MPLRNFVSALAVLTAAGCAVAQTPKDAEDHSAHHPAGSPTVGAAPAPVAPVVPDGFDMQMNAMQDMHRRMQSARTQAERAALMDEHMKIMQSGMAMMGQMRGMGGPGGQGGKGMPPSQPPASGAMQQMQGMAGMMDMHRQMERRMAMMEQMMQMMVDREAAMPRK
ncbi:hypothetical protein [Cupriavidus sp. UGS-1]|uniref:hypothetical protein n=1 Tax=Cupriavidus sp. UGS-1 TaxID=2899826 RepID=UPI001E4144BB|nr:hypothetical protein [Cupriavidus sp. UGS-1]MCD9120662.1 hypothetical protein [Cupriavidus sp. UGS-1]